MDTPTKLEALKRTIPKYIRLYMNKRHIFMYRYTSEGEDSFTTGSNFPLAVMCEQNTAIAQAVKLTMWEH